MTQGSAPATPGEADDIARAACDHWGAGLSTNARRPFPQWPAPSGPGGQRRGPKGHRRRGRRRQEVHL
eukprot:4445031-Pyramimonas_sp.AAC.1